MAFFCLAAITGCAFLGFGATVRNPVGTCLVSGDGSPFGPKRQVPCDQPHHYEVVQAWPHDTWGVKTDKATGEMIGVRDADYRPECEALLKEYVGPEPARGYAAALDLPGTNDQDTPFVVSCYAYVADPDRPSVGYPIARTVVGSARP